MFVYVLKGYRYFFCFFDNGKLFRMLDLLAFLLTVPVLSLTHSIIRCNKCFKFFSIWIHNTGVHNIQNIISINVKGFFGRCPKLGWVPCPSYSSELWTRRDQGTILPSTIFIPGIQTFRANILSLSRSRPFPNFWPEAGADFSYFDIYQCFGSGSKWIRSF